jgi:hypothetical protein
LSQVCWVKIDEAEEHGPSCRKPVLVAGWLVGLPVPLLLMWAPTWGWVVAANMLLGVNQGWRGRSRSS